MRQPMFEFVPGTTTAYPVAMSGVPAAGYYRLVGRISPAGAPVIRVDTTFHIGGRIVAKARRSLEGAAIARHADTGGMGMIMWLGIGGLAAVAGAFAVAFARMRRRLKAVTAARDEQRS
jgi:hypothetical protein